MTLNIGWGITREIINWQLFTCLCYYSTFSDSVNYKMTLNIGWGITMQIITTTHLNVLTRCELGSCSSMVFKWRHFLSLWCYFVALCYTERFIGLTSGKLHDFALSPWLRSPRYCVIKCLLACACLCPFVGTTMTTQHSCIVELCT